MYTAIGTCYPFRPLCCPATDSGLRGIMSTSCCIHTFVPPDDGPRYARNM